MMPEKTRIGIEVLDGECLRRERVMATVLGDWAFHPNWQAAGWQVTHVPSGKNLGACVDHFSYREAMQICGRLGLAAIKIHVGPGGEVEPDESRYLIHAIVGEAIHHEEDNAP